MKIVFLCVLDSRLTILLNQSDTIFEVYIYKKTHQEIFKISSWVGKGRRKFEEARYWKAYSWEQKQTCKYTKVAGVKMG